MESITIWQILMLVGIPTTITSSAIGLFFKHFEKRMDKKEKIREKKEAEREKAREEHEVLVVKSINASMALGEATAEAVARIPDAHCNGDMHAALEYAREVKHEQKDFLTRQAVKTVM